MLPGTLGFLGFGNMGGAILGGLIESGAFSGKHAVIFDPAQARQGVAEQLGARVAASPDALARECGIILLAVKPQTMEDALRALAPGLAHDPLLVSIAAGISMDWIRKRVPAGVRVARVMPNTPALCHAGAAGIALGPECTESDARAVRTMFEAVGIAELVEESAMDAVTALSGSGPAYFFHMVECLVQAGVAQGLSEPVAARLAAQTLLGAGCLLQTSGESAATLRARVTSPGGTTAAALRQLAAEGFEQSIFAAVEAAAKRSRELGKDML